MAEQNLPQKMSELVQPDERSTGMTTQAARAVAEVQGAMTIAKKFPRDEEDCFKRIMRACKRRGLAESAAYEFPRGGTKVTGPSIRLAEALAQNWGNMDTGVVELERRDGESTAMAYAVDLETNYRKSVIFSVPHERTAGKRLTDPRDIYETVMNNGSRRLRNCILAVIPGDIADEVVAACEATLKGAAGAEPIQDRIRSMLAAFDSFNVTSEMVAKKYGCKTEALSEAQLVALRRIYSSLKDGVGKVADFFEQPKPDTGAELQAALAAPPAPAQNKTETVAPKVAAEEKPAPSAPTAHKAPASQKPAATPGSFDDQPTGLFVGQSDPRNVK